MYKNNQIRYTYIKTCTRFSILCTRFTQRVHIFRFFVHVLLNVSTFSDLLYTKTNFKHTKTKPMLIQTQQ